MMVMTKKEKKEIIKSVIEEVREEYYPRIVSEVYGKMGSSIPVNIGINLLTKTAKVPIKARDGDACWDIFSDQVLPISSQRTVGIRTGISLDIPEGYMIEIRSRSGMAYNNSISVLNAPATIDSGYKDEIVVILHNNNISIPYIVNKGRRIAQMRLVKLQDMVLKVGITHGVPDRKGGLGSTDV